jgi:hypothetical protein
MGTDVQRVPVPILCKHRNHMRASAGPAGGRTRHADVSSPLGQHLFDVVVVVPALLTDLSPPVSKGPLVQEPLADEVTEVVLKRAVRRRRDFGGRQHLTERGEPAGG